MRLVLLGLALALALAGCGGTTTVSQCSGTVMGKLMGTFSVCNELDQRYRQNLDTWAVTAVYNELPTVFTWSTEWEIKGEPRVTTPMKLYNERTPNLKCNVTVKKGAQTWVARSGAGVVASGTCQLDVTDVTELEALGNVKTYKVKGGITALLEAEPGTGATETVSVQMTLCQGDGALCPPPTMM